MRENVVLALLKIVGVFALVLAVGLSTCQAAKWEDRTERLNKSMSDLRAEISSQKGAISRLERALRSGKFSSGGTNGGGTQPVDDDTMPAPGEMESFAWNDEAPKFLKGRAAELWGAYGDNFLKPDPDWPKNPSLDDPKVNADAGLTLWYGTAPKDLNPFTLSDGAVNRYVRVYADEYLGLPHAKNPYHYKPGLAYRAEVSKDFKTWIFWIRPGVRWHRPQVDLEKYPHLAGEHFLTAHDFKFTFDMVLNKEVRAAHYRSYFVDLDRIEVVDDHCLIMHWNKSSFSSIGASMNLLGPRPKFIWSKDAAGNTFDPASIGSRLNEHWFGQQFKWVGTGPYYIREYTPKAQAVLIRNEDYWGDLPAMQSIKRDMFPNRDLMYTKFEAGEHAYASYLGTAFEKRVKDRPELKDGRWGVHWSGSSQYAFIAYKNTHPIFRDPKVRRAMTHACDRASMLQAVNKGKGTIITGPQYWRAPTCPKDLKPLAFALKQAKQLLTEAGWKDADGNGILEKDIDGTKTEFKVKAMIPETAFWRAIFEIFSEDLAKIGVEMELETLHWAQFSQRLDERRFDMTALFWSTTGWDSDMTQIWHSSQIEDPESSNFIEFSDAKVDEYIDKARYEFDLDERVRLQSAAHRRINELQPYTFLFSMQTAAVYWKSMIHDLADADQWLSRPFIRLFPLYTPSER